MQQLAEQAPLAAAVGSAHGAGAASRQGRIIRNVTPDALKRALEVAKQSLQHTQGMGVKVSEDFQSARLAQSG